MKHLLALDSHPIQYRVPVFRELARLFAESGDRLTVVYASDSSVRGAMDKEFGRAVSWDEPMLDGYSQEFLPGANECTPGGFRSLKGEGIESAIRRLRPDAVLLSGLNYLLSVRALLICRWLGIPVWLRSETQDEAFPRGRLKGLLRSLIYRVGYAPLAHVFPIGKLNAAHYRAHGIPDEKMTFCHYCVVDRFDMPEAAAEARRRAKRAELGIADETVVIMFSGKLIPKKTPLVLIEALEGMPMEERRRYALLYVGSGEQESMLRERAAQIGVPVAFAGFVNQAAIADYYLAADALALPSQRKGETWGLVANEGLLAGRPVILSQHAGASADFKDFLGVQVLEPEAGAMRAAFRRVVEMPRGKVLRNQLADYSVVAAARAILSVVKNSARPVR